MMPLVVHRKEWNRIIKWADPDKEDPEVVRRREYVKYLNDTSTRMAKDWPNSLENVNKRNEELRRERIEAAEQANHKFYKKYLKRKDEDQQRMMYSARDTIFKNKDAPKLLLSAVIETVVQKERQVQVDFLREERRKEVEKKQNDDKEIIRKAKEWHQLMENRARRRFQVNKQHQREILEQAHEISERDRKEYEEELSMQKVDNLKAQQQMEAIKEFEENFKAAEKQRIWSDMEQSKKEVLARRREQAARDDMDEKLINVLMRSRARIDEKRRQTEKEKKEEHNRIIDNISKKLESGDADRDAKEQAILDKAIREKDAIDQARRDAQKRKEAQFKADKVAQRQKFLKDEAERLHHHHTMKQWEMMNRFKNEEIYDAFKEKLRKEREQKIQEFKADTLRLWKERTDREAKELADTRSFYGTQAEQKLRLDDNRLLTHAAALIAEARHHGRPTLPIQKAVDTYCKLYRLYPMPELPKSLQEHYQGYAPADKSMPDEWYKDPPLPPPDLGPDAPDEEEAPPKVEKPKEQRDEIDPKPAPPPAKKVEETVDDYKRQGRANGLQNRRNAIADLILPPITVKPCETSTCACVLKK